ncbi:MAG: cupin domain-containing protein [bacterium]
MIRKSNEMTSETRMNMREGKGPVEIKHYFKEGDIKAKCRLCAELTLPPGSSIGIHPHKSEDEVFIILKGSGITDDGFGEMEIKEGDTTLTRSGESHSIRNNGSENLLIAAIIMQY